MVDQANRRVLHAKRTIGGDSVDLCDVGKDGSAPPLPILRYYAILRATAGDCPQLSRYAQKAVARGAPEHVAPEARVSGQVVLLWFVSIANS